MHATQWSSIHNRLDCLMWLREHGCPWEASVMNHAAGGNGNLEILKWAHENGCPWNEIHSQRCQFLVTLK